MADEWANKGLPTRIIRGSYRETVPETRLRTQMDTGPPKVRNRHTAGYRVIQFDVPMTSAEVALMEAFYVMDLTRGADTFTKNDIRTGTEETFRFVQPPEYTELREIFSCHVVLELLP